MFPACFYFCEIILRHLRKDDFLPVLLPELLLQQAQRIVHVHTG